MEAKSLSQEDWQYIEEKTKLLFGRVAIRFDDFHVVYKVEHYSATKANIVTYVNGEWHGVWCSGDKPCPQQQFMRRLELSVYKPKVKADILKKFGKRSAKKYFPNLDKKIVAFDICWASWSPVVRHIKKIAPAFASVELLRGDA